MTVYFGIVHKDIDSAYGVTFPDLPGCFSAADALDEVMPQAQAALSLYASGESELPGSRSMDELTRDREVQQALASGAFVIAVPLVQSDRKVRTNVMLDRSLLSAIDRQARASGVSRSEYLAQAAKRRLQADGAVVIERPPAARARRAGKA